MKQPISRQALLAFISAALLSTACTPRSPSPLGSPARERPPAILSTPARVVAPLRIALLVDGESLSVLLPTGGRLIWEGGSMEIPPEGDLTIQWRNIHNLMLRGEGESRVLPPAVSVLPVAGEPFHFRGRPYAGTLDVFADSTGLVAINRIGLESYLRGVVPWEIGFLKEEKIEALKAQAVAARTYALSQIDDSGELWDLRSDEQDQVYRGLEKTDRVVDRAIDETAGIVAAYGNELLRTYYSSTCGGRTAPLEEIWFDREPAPYLRGVHDAPGRSPDPERAYCRASPRFSWSVEINGFDAIDSVMKELARESDRDQDELGRLRNVRVERRGRSGRVHTVLFETEGGEIPIRGDRVRWVLRRPSDGGILRSSWIRLKVNRSRGFVREIQIEGRGFGHGIGMCQWGAMGLAEAGYSFEQILSHYYPGVRLVDLGAGTGEANGR